MFFRTELSLKVDQAIEIAKLNLKRIGVTADQLYGVLKLDASKAEDAVSPDQKAIDTALAQLKFVQTPYWTNYTAVMEETRELIQRRWWLPLKVSEAPWEDQKLTDDFLDGAFDLMREELNNIVSFSKGLSVDRMQSTPEPQS